MYKEQAAGNERDREKDKTIRETDEKTGGHLVLFVRRNAVYIAVFLIGAAFLLVVLFMVQAIYHGFPPVIVSILTILTGTVVSLLLLNGCSRRTAVSALSTVLGVAVTGIIFYISSKTLHLTGFYRIF